MISVCFEWYFYEVTSPTTLIKTLPLYLHISVVMRYIPVVARARRRKCVAIICILLAVKIIRNTCINMMYMVRIVMFRCSCIIHHQAVNIEGENAKLSLHKDK